MVDEWWLTRGKSGSSGGSSSSGSSSSSSGGGSSSSSGGGRSGSTYGFSSPQIPITPQKPGLSGLPKMPSIPVSAIIPAIIPFIFGSSGRGSTAGSGRGGSGGASLRYQGQTFRRRGAFRCRPYALIANICDLVAAEVHPAPTPAERRQLEAAPSQITGAANIMEVERHSRTSPARDPRRASTPCSSAPA